MTALICPSVAKTGITEGWLRWAARLQSLAVDGFVPIPLIATIEISARLRTSAGLPLRGTGALARHRAPKGQYLVPGARPEGDAVSDGRRLQWPQGARFVPISVGVAR